MDDGENEVKYMVSVADNTARLAVFGRANYLNCRKIGDFFSRVLSKGCRKIIVDCSACSGMDSTFLGTLAGAALKLRKSGGEFIMTNLRGRNLEIAENLGLDKIVKIVEADGENTAGQSALETQTADAKSILAAHKNLVEADSANMSKFENVINFLEKDAANAD